MFVTGAHGFVGNNLMKLLKNKQCEILSPTSKELDLTKEEQVKDYFFTHKPDIVLHLAGKVGGIAANKAAPGDFFYKNILSWSMQDRQDVRR